MCFATFLQINSEALILKSYQFKKYMDILVLQSTQVSQSENACCFVTITMEFYFSINVIVILQNQFPSENSILIGVLAGVSIVIIITSIIIAIVVCRKRLVM